MKKINHYIYQLSLSLPDNPLKEVHSYIIKDGHKALLIDTGFNHDETKEKILNILGSKNSY